MIDRETAYQLALSSLPPPNYDMRKQGDSLVIIESSTIEKDYGWIFFWNSKKYMETKNDRYLLYGGGPIVVEKVDGSIHQLGSAGGAEYQIELYEAQRDKGNKGN